MNIVSKLVRGNDPRRSTRFHDENNQFIGWSQLRFFPYSVATSLYHKATGNLPDLPWWPFSVIEYIEEIIQPDWNVLEFGCGISSIWLAKRAATVISIEGSCAWCEKIRADAKRRGLNNLTIKLRDSSLYPDRGKFSQEFNDFFADTSEFKDTKFDLVIVDGAARFLCVQNSLSLIKEGGYLYFDNSDADKDWAHYTDPSMSKLAQKFLKQVEDQGEGSLTFLRGLCPATPHASEGLIFQKSFT